MIKRSKAVIPIVLLCMLFPAGKTVRAQEPSALYFDTDAVQNKTAAKSALADMHGVFVFRDAFIEAERQVKEEENRQREETERLVLASIQPELVYQEWVDIVLQADNTKYIKDIYQDEQENTLFLWIYCGIISVSLLCIALRIEDYMRKQKEFKSE